MFRLSLCLMFNVLVHVFVLVHVPWKCFMLISMAVVVYADVAF